MSQIVWDLKKMSYRPVKVGQLRVGWSSSLASPRNWTCSSSRLLSSAWQWLSLLVSWWPLSSRRYSSIYQHQRQKIQLLLSCVFLLKKPFLGVSASGILPPHIPDIAIYSFVESPPQNQPLVKILEHFPLISLDTLTVTYKSHIVWMVPEKIKFLPLGYP